MHAVTNIAPKADGRAIPWNKGKLIGQKPPLKLKEIWAIRIRLQLDVDSGNSRCSISQSIASCAAATSSAFASTT